MTEGLPELIHRANELVDRLESLLPPATAPLPWATLSAARWLAKSSQLSAVNFSADVRPSDLLGIERQHDLLDQNTRQFIAGHPANHALLWGAKGTGKSSLIRALIGRYQQQGLRVIEMGREDLGDLPEVVHLIADQPYKFIIYCDDLSFEAGDSGYKALKVAIDGGLGSSADNMIIYATSNRRHLLPEYQEENLQARVVGTEIHHGDATEEKISLSERFGLWLSFHPFNQDQYLQIVDHWLGELGVGGIDQGENRAEALRWALGRGSRSGRVAWQFARHQAGKERLGSAG